jgi:hypothetical protein
MTASGARTCRYDLNIHLLSIGDLSIHHSREFHGWQSGRPHSVSVVWVHLPCSCDKPRQCANEGGKHRKKHHGATEHPPDLALAAGSSQRNTELPRKSCFRSRQTNRSFPREREPKLP